MEKRTYKTGRELTNKQWKILGPLLPEVKNSPKGGQKRAPNRACLEAILWLLRTRARWRDIPDRFPSGSTCWRRMQEWQEADLWTDIWQKLLGMLDAKGRLKWEEFFADGTFSLAKKGRKRRKNQAREGNKAYGGGRWSGHTYRA